MTVRELKKKLSKLPDDFEVKMLLPLVDDWADIKIQKVSMYRMRKEVLCEVVNKQNEILFNAQYGENRRTDYTPDEMTEKPWEINDGFVRSMHSDEEFNETYETKEAILIVNKSRGKTDWDRYGSIQY